jgi:hypothetical protein
MMPADSNKRLFELQDATYVVTLLDGKSPVETKLFNPGSYGEALVWVTAKYREGNNWTIEVKTPQVNNRPPIKVICADGEVR